ncbi:MAG: FAD-dependent oxidoreductase [Chloroflexi bacterium]|nr:FAD-dependent oxidoreductase [Chloroflexota bacterium]
MTAKPGTSDNPLRVAIIGSGPSGFYAAEALQKQKDYVVEIDMFDRLPTPYGLVRGGVAPDHDKIKSVTKVYDRIAQKPNFRFYGNVEFGTDITHDDLLQHYHQVIYAVGAQTDRKLGIPGEELLGSHPATEFVAWYNGHPDYRDYEFDLTQEAAVVVGIGNVAMDVARILARSYNELVKTDIADYALEALNNSNVKRIYVLGRRGPAQAAFTNPEIKELGEMEESEIIIGPDEVDLDPLSQEYLDNTDDRKDIRNVEILKEYAAREPDASKPKQIIMHFLTSPVEIIGTDRVEAVKIVKNELYKNEKGVLRPRATDQTRTIEAGLVFRSVGYRGVPLPGVPFREDWGIIPNEDGRVIIMDTKEAVIGEYVVGWIKRGPSGVIGTNKPDSQDTVRIMLDDLGNDIHLKPTEPSSDAVEKLLGERNVRYVSYEDWQLLDKIEQERGEAIGRPRLKLSRVDEMLDAIEERKRQEA